MRKHISTIVFIWNIIGINLLIPSNSVDANSVTFSVSEIKKMIIQARFPWIDDHLYGIIHENVRIHPQVDEMLVVSMMEKESRVKQLQGPPEKINLIPVPVQRELRINATGPSRRVWLMRDGEKYQKTVKAHGIMMIMPFHYKGNPDDLYDPEVNIRLGVQILADCSNRYDSDIYILRCYNAGPRGRKFNWDYINEVTEHYEAMSEKMVDTVAELDSMGIEIRERE